MTVPSTPRRAGPYYGTGVLVAYPFTFKTFDKHDLRVVVADAGGVETDLVVDSSVLIALNADQNANPGGSLQYAVSGVAAALPAGYSLVILSALGYAQQADLPEGGSYRAAAVEQGLDALAIQIQQVIEQIYRTLTLSPLVGADVDATLPPPQADRLIGWNSAATRLQNMDPQTLATIVAYGTAKADIFTGDGVETEFTLSDNPGNLYNLDVSIDGASKLPNVDYFWDGGTKLTTASPVPNAEKMLARYMQGLPQSGAALPNLAGKAGRWLKNLDGADPSWESIDSSDIAFVPALVGAQPTSVATELNNTVVNVLRFIPVEQHAAIISDSSTYDCRPAIQAAIDALGPRGGTLRVPRGRYELSHSGDQCLLITCPIIFEGDGYFSVLKPKSSVPDTVDVIRYAPSPSVDCSQSAIRHFFIGDPNTGTRYGRNAIFLDTRATDSYLPQLEISGNYFGQGPTSAGKSVYHLHDPLRANNATQIANGDPAGTNGANGGLYGSKITENQMRGGIHLDNSGDSIWIEQNVISGAGVGIFASTIVGASQLAIIENNITAQGGAICIDNARRLAIKRNNIEQTVALAGANGTASVYLRGSNGVITQYWIAENNIGAFSGTGVQYNVRVGNADIGDVEKNQLLPADSSSYALAFFAAATNWAIKKNQHYSLGSVLKVYDGGGAGARGVRRTPTLQNSWVAYDAAFADVYYCKDEEGYVTVQGVIKDGTAVNPTVLFNLPAGYRPAKSEFISVYSQNSSAVPVLGAILVSAGSGNVIYTAGDNSCLSVACRFRAADDGWFDSSL